MAEKSSTSKRLDPNDPATRQEIADALGTKPDDPAVTDWIAEHNSDVRILFAESSAQGQDVTAPVEPVAPAPVGETSFDPFTGEPYTIPPVEVGVLSSNEEQELRNTREILDMARRGITRESFEDPKGIATPVTEVQLGELTGRTYRVVYPDRRLVTIQDIVDESGDGTRTETVVDFANGTQGARQTPLEAGVPSGPPVVMGGGTANFGPSTDDRASAVTDLIDNSDVLDAIRPGGPTTDAGRELLDQFPDLTGGLTNTGTAAQPGVGVNSPTSTTNPTQGNPSPTNQSSSESPIDRGDPYSPSFPSSGSSGQSSSSPASDLGMDNTPGESPSQPGAGSDGPGVAKVLSDTTDANGVRQVTWMDSNGNTWANDGTNPTFFVGQQVNGQMNPNDTPPSTPPPPVPPPTPAEDKPAEEEKTEEQKKEEEEAKKKEEEEAKKEEEEKKEEDEGMYDPDAGGSSNGVGVVTGGEPTPDYGSAHGAGVTDFGRGDLGIGGITGEIHVRVTAGPDVNPDADPTGVDLVTGGVLQPDWGSSTGAGVTDFGREPPALGEFEPPTDDGVNPYANTDESATIGVRGATEFDAQIIGLDSLAGAALDVSAQTIEFDASDFDAGDAATEQQQPDGLGAPDPFEG
jgi:hypothetical protein